MVYYLFFYLNTLIEYGKTYRVQAIYHGVSDISSGIGFTSVNINVLPAYATFAVTREWYRIAYIKIWSLPAGQELVKVELSGPASGDTGPISYNSNNCRGVTLQIGRMPQAVGHINNGNWTFYFIYKSGVKQVKTFYAYGGHEAWYDDNAAYSLEYNSSAGLSEGRKVPLIRV